MKRVVTLLLAAFAGLLLAGLVMGMIVPAAAGREGPMTAVVVTAASIAATLGVAVFAMRRG
jgi:hypothetical protein